MKLIDVDELQLYYGGLAHISPQDFEGTAKYFMGQVKAAPTIEAIPIEFIDKLITNPWYAGSKSWVLSWLKREWKKREYNEKEKDKSK